MAAITAQMVKELRERTGQGMMECKKALQETDGDIELAIENMRKSGAIKAAKKSGNVAAEGVIAIKNDGTFATILEVNSQTDFLVIDENFKAFVADTLNLAFNEKITDVAELATKQEEKRVALVAKTGENVNIRRLAVAKGDIVGSYLHGVNAKIGSVVVLKGGNAELANDIAMHIAASAPQFLTASDVPEDWIAKETEIYTERQAEMLASKPEAARAGIIKGAVNKLISEVSLNEQKFVKDPTLSIAQLVKNAGASIVSFTRFAVGEGIEKVETDFAAEVAAQVAASKH